MAQCKEYKGYNLPHYRGEPLVNHVPRLDVDGLELLGNLLAYEGKNRVNAREAMKHTFLASLPQAVHTLKDSEFYSRPILEHSSPLSS